MSATKPVIRPEPPPVQDWPAYWLVCLERAVAEGEYSAAADAQRELRRLGIDVTMRLMAKRGEVPHVA